MADSTPGNNALAPVTPSPDLKLDDTFIFAGDVRILATHNKARIEGTASSDALCLASPVWKKFLFPPWENEKAGEVKQIDFTEDDSVALLLLLSIAHLKFRRIPDQLPHYLLLQVAILCDQYDCVDLVRPWLSDALWLQNEEEEAFRVGQQRWLFIAWVFGRQTVFEQLAVKLVKETSMDSALKFLSPMPPGIVESIQSHRLRLVAKLLKIPYDILDRYETKSNTFPSQRYKTHLCRHNEDKSACDALIYGSITIGLSDYGLFPRKSPDEVFHTVDELANTIRVIKIHRVGNGTEHENCGHLGPLGFHNPVQEVLDKAFDPVLDAHRVHMAAQK